MELKGSILNWKINVAEAIGLATTTAVTVLWVTTTFQSKADAQELKKTMEERIARIESEMSTLRESVQSISRDTSYIRGRLEPHNSK